MDTRGTTGDFAAIQEVSQMVADMDRAERQFAAGAEYGPEHLKRAQDAMRAADTAAMKAHKLKTPDSHAKAADLHRVAAHHLEKIASPVGAKLYRQRSLEHEDEHTKAQARLPKSQYAAASDLGYRDSLPNGWVMGDKARIDYRLNRGVKKRLNYSAPAGAPSSGQPQQQNLPVRRGAEGQDSYKDDRAPNPPVQTTAAPNGTKVNTAQQYASLAGDVKNQERQGKQHALLRHRLVRRVMYPDISGTAYGHGDAANRLDRLADRSSSLSHEQRGQIRGLASVQRSEASRRMNRKSGEFDAGLKPVHAEAPGKAKSRASKPLDATAVNKESFAAGMTPRQQHIARHGVALSKAANDISNIADKAAVYGETAKRLHGAAFRAHADASDYHRKTGDTLSASGHDKKAIYHRKRAS